MPGTGGYGAAGAGGAYGCGLRSKRENKPCLKLLHFCLSPYFRGVEQQTLLYDQIRKPCTSRTQTDFQPRYGIVLGTGTEQYSRADRGSSGNF